MAKCVVPGCGNPVRWQQYVCQECENKYGKPFPEWLVYLVQEEGRERKRKERERVVTVPYDDEIDYENYSRLPSERGLGDAFDECDEMGVDWESIDW